MLTAISRPLHRYWMKLPYRWRRRIVIAAIVWVLIRILILTFGFEMLLLWLIVGFGLAFALTELGLRKADAMESWLYGQLTGQLQSIVTGAIIPVVIEMWVRYFSSKTQDELITASITTALFAYMVLFMRKSLSLALDSQIKSRRRSRE